MRLGLGGGPPHTQEPPRAKGPGIVSAARAAPVSARGRREPLGSVQRRHARRPALTCRVPRLLEPRESTSHLRHPTSISACAGCDLESRTTPFPFSHFFFFSRPAKRVSA